MNVLFDHQIFVAQKFGGISRYFNELSVAEGIKVSKIPAELFYEKEVHISNNLFARSIRFAKRKAGIPKKSSFYFPELASNMLTDNKIDIFHPTYYDPYFLKYTSKPFVITVYDMIHEIYKEYFSLSDKTTYNKLLLCNKAKHIIAISENTKSDLINIFKIPAEKISVTLLASDFAGVKVSENILFDTSKKNILYTGTRHAYKNFYYPLVAIAQLMREDNLLQVVCTGHGFSNDELAYFEHLGITGRIIHLFLKNDSELAWAYKHAHLFIFPSLYEGFGFPLLEAFASGCPTVSSNGGSLPEVGGNAALYFDPKSIDEIKKVLVKALYDMTVREKLIQNGFVRLQDFSWEKCRQQTVAVYEKVLNKLA